MTNSANAGLMMGTAKPVFTNTLIAREISIGCVTTALTSLDRQQYEGDAMLKTPHSPPLYHVNGNYWERPQTHRSFESRATGEQSRAGRGSRRQISL